MTEPVSVFVLLYSAEGRQAYMGLDLDTKGVFTSRDLALAKMEEIARLSPVQGAEFYLEEWELDGTFLAGQDQVYPVGEER